MLQFKNNSYCVNEIPVSELAAQYGTPVYIYDADQITQNYRALADAFTAAGLHPGIYFAVKANYNLAVLSHIRSLGAGADIVSGGEMRRALAAGIPAHKIIFSGVAKTDGELRAALAAGIRQINLESAEELDRLTAIAGAMNVTVDCTVRVIPDVDAGTHAKITTGKSENKFGVDFTTARRIFDAARGGAARMRGLAIHIGSQILDMSPFDAAFGNMAGFMRELESAGHPLDVCDIGGGIGVPYQPGQAAANLNLYVQSVKKYFGGFGGHIATAPGRYLTANAGVLVTQIEFIKRTAHRSFVVVDAAMTELLRPAMYDAYHPIFPAQETRGDAMVCDIVGGVCESSDVFARGRELPAGLKAGDFLIIGIAGAYGATMSSTYNARDLVPEVMVRGGHHALVRQRWGIMEQMALESIPDVLMEKQDTGDKN